MRVELLIALLEFLNLFPLKINHKCKKTYKTAIFKTIHQNPIKTR
jgi:hypothetical protein